VGWLGLEPRTNALKGRCSTIELPTRKESTEGIANSLRCNPKNLSPVGASLRTIARLLRVRRVTLVSQKEARNGEQLELEIAPLVFLRPIHTGSKLRSKS
jgi:hypothetical protein